MSSRRSLILGGTAALLAPTLTRPIAYAAAPAEAASDWQTASPESQGISSSGLEVALASGAAVAALRGVVVARNGLLVGERYYAGASSSDLFAINSATKSVCSMLVGNALQEGKLKSLSQTVSDLLPDLAQRFPGSPANAVTLSQILTGTTGLAYDYTTQFRALMSAPDPTQYVLGLPRDAAAPSSWSYNDAAVSLLTPILERASGLPLAELAKRALFAPLGIEWFSWRQDSAGRALAYAGLHLRTRDLLKLAWLMADHGNWNGASVLRSDWSEDSTRRHVAATWRNPPIADTGYGYLWFTGTLQDKAVAWAWGYGGQFALFVPALKLAVATAATDPRPQDLRAQTAAVMAVVAQVVQAAG